MSNFEFQSLRILVDRAKEEGPHSKKSSKDKNYWAEQARPVRI